MPAFLLLLKAAAAMDVLVHGELLSRNHSTEHHHVCIRHHMVVAWCDQRRVLEVLPQRRMATKAKNSNMNLLAATGEHRECGTASQRQQLLEFWDYSVT